MSNKPHINQIVNLSIERLGINGEGVASLEGFTIFVEGALPGEKVTATVQDVRKNFARAKLDKLLTTSPHRQNPSCPVFGQCGGCQLMHLDYSKQLVIKRQRVIDALERIGKFSNLEVLPCKTSPQKLSYRNKIQLPSGMKNSQIYLGLYAYNTHDLIDIGRCAIHCSLGEMAFQKIKRLLQSYKITQEDLKCVLIKTAVHTKQVLVILITPKKEIPILSILGEKIMEAMPEIKGVVQNVNSSTNNTVLGKEFHTLIGDSFIEETLLGLRFQISPASFFQVNPEQAENLYQTVLDYAFLTGREVVLDAYCGVGTLSLILAKKALSVVGVECVKEAIEDAKKNARINNISNVQFTCDHAENFIASLKEIDVCVLNPPRKGCEPSFLEALSHLKPKKIIYISCDPGTLARDLFILGQTGYHINHVEPFDMFPQTVHVECVALLS